MILAQIKMHMSERLWYSRNSSAQGFEVRGSRDLLLPTLSSSLRMTRAGSCTSARIWRKMGATDLSHLVRDDVAAQSHISGHVLAEQKRCIPWISRSVKVSTWTPAKVPSSFAHHDVIRWTHFSRRATLVSVSKSNSSPMHPSSAAVDVQASPAGFRWCLPFRLG